jgi:hypothetical protein
MAFRDETRQKWIRFEIDLGNKAHRDAFRAGKVPPGLTTY